MAASKATAYFAPEDEYVRLKLELAQVTAATDTKRLQSRTLISERDGLREDAEKITAETEGQQVCFSLCTSHVWCNVINLIMCDRHYNMCIYSFALYHQKIIQKIRESNEKLREQIKVAEDETTKLLNLIDGDGESSIARR